MKVQVQKSFEKDIAGISDKKLAIQLKAILTNLEDCKAISAVKHVKKMAGGGNYYRIRAGNYRLGFKLDSDTIILLRFMHRKEIYNYFP